MVFQPLNIRVGCPCGYVTWWIWSLPFYYISEQNVPESIFRIYIFLEPPLVVKGMQKFEKARLFLCWELDVPLWLVLEKCSWISRHVPAITWVWTLCGEKKIMKLYYIYVKFFWILMVKVQVKLRILVKLLNDLAVDT